MVAHSSLFKSGGSQTVRLPKSVAFPEGVSKVVILKAGAGRVIAPADASWDDFFDKPGMDLGQRVQLEAEARGSLGEFSRFSGLRYEDWLA